MPTPNSILDVQVGKETTWGTAVTPTARLMGVRKCSLVPVQDGGILPEMRATLMPGYTGVVRSIEGVGNIEYTAGYEDINYYLETMFGVVSPSGSNPYTRAGAAPSTAPTLRMMTLVHGDSTAGVYKLAGGIGAEMKLSGNSHGEVTGSNKLVGKSIASGTLASLNDRTFNPLMGNQATIYMDAWGGTIGSTALDLTMFAWELSVKNATEPLVRHFNGALTPSGYAYRTPSPDNCTLKVSLEFNSSSKTILDSVVGGTLNQKQWRIKYVSGSLEFQLDFAGSLVDGAEELFKDNNGIAAVDLVYKGTYNSTLGNWLKYSSVNAVSALA